MRTKVDRILSAAVLLPALLFALATTGSAGWRCSFDGIARPASCCPKASAHVTTPAPVAISAQECCDFERVVHENAPSDVTRTIGPGAVASAVAMPAGVAPAFTVPTPPQAALAVFREHPPGARSLLIQKHAFLI